MGSLSRRREQQLCKGGLGSRAAAFGRFRPVNTPPFIIPALRFSVKSSFGIASVVRRNIVRYSFRVDIKNPRCLIARSAGMLWEHGRMVIHRKAPLNLFLSTTALEFFVNGLIGRQARATDRLFRSQSHPYSLLRPARRVRLTRFQQPCTKGQRNPRGPAPKASGDEWVL